MLGLMEPTAGSLTVLGAVRSGDGMACAAVVGKTPQLAFLLAATLHSLIALVTFASLAMLLSMLVPDRMKAMFFSGAIIIVLSVAGQFKVLRWLNPLAPFGSPILIQHLTAQFGRVVAGVVLSVCMLWTSYRVLQRQEF
jgi:ABC-type transport system involved in multi-copper enzyme maturation permease subunit